MDKLTFPITPDDDLVCGVSALVAAGQPVLRPIHGHALIDTGATKTSVSSSILRKLGLNVPTVQTTTMALTGSVRVDLFEVGVCIIDGANPSAPMHVLPDLLVMELPAPLGQVDVLIGMDILLTTRFVLDEHAPIQFELDSSLEAHARRSKRSPRQPLA